MGLDDVYRHIPERPTSTDEQKVLAGRLVDARGASDLRDMLGLVTA